MQRTQISLEVEQRRLLDEAAARTGKSISALIRDAVEAVYGAERSAERDLALMRRGIGAWRDRDTDGEAWVEQMRTGRRLSSVE